ncbi:DUF3429 domain-containing protein [Vibrio brasiliensis]|uniref:DUF3429 domain-containing protein n=1 Tax=Vibrio brasiliensis TaxID=170652 RepID=UPI001EFC70D9|nr:DUF3429 domain-containing protein [Vibrio brasiliensis]MCG9647335.1 DUF3429 domain-containing protein [Vibrio brasiliensis]
MDSDNKTIQQLGYWGLVPFFLGTVMIAFDMQILAIGGTQLFISYSAVILSFLSGVLWGRSLNHQVATSKRIALIASNVFALMAWLLLLQTSQSVTAVIALLGVGYVAIWYFEKRTWRDKLTDPYQIMRRNLTGMVAGLHLVVVFV